MSNSVYMFGMFIKMHLLLENHYLNKYKKEENKCDAIFLLSLMCIKIMFMHKANANI